MLIFGRIIMSRSAVDLLDDDMLESFYDECLLRSFCNHVYFGQWHLAEAFFTAHKELKSRHLTDIPSLFRRMIENPYGARLSVCFAAHVWTQDIDKTSNLMTLCSTV